MRGTAGLRILPQVYGTNDAGSGTESWAAARSDASESWVRLSVTFTAGSNTTKIFAAFVVYGGATANGGYIEADRYQIEEGSRATGWRDNGQVASAQQSATSVAIDALTSSVSQQAGSLSSVSGRTTTLENTVNSASGGLGTKASAESVTSLGNRVKQTEDGLSSTSSNVVDLKNSIATVQKTVEGAVGLDPAPGCLWQFDTDAEGWYGANATISNGKGYLRVTATAANPQLQSAAAAIGLTGSLFTKVRARITRRGGTGWRGTLYYSTPGHSFSSSIYSTLPNPNLAVGDTAIVEWDMANLNSGGTDWVDSSISRLRLDLGASSGDVFDVDWIAVGRVAPAASSRALTLVESTVTQQGTRIESEAKRTDGLYTSVGNANSAIQDETTARATADSALSKRITTAQAKADDALAAAQSEVTARADADTALGKRVDTVQSNLGSTNASVQQISTAQTSLNNKVNASYSVRLQVTAGGQYVAAGFGLGADNSSGVLQSVFAVMADRFAVLNPSGNGFVSPFAIQNGQVFLNEAFISSATIQKAIVGNSINSSELANNGVPIMRMDFASGTIIMQNKAASAYTVFNRSGIDMVINGVRRIRMGEW